MTKKQYIAPISENVFPETIMEGWNPGQGGGITPGVIIGASGGATTVDPTHIICAPGRGGVKFF